ncbi:MAG: type I pantothenate kinase [Propionibacterium sp.]|nr:MAG: type I pantothenate kinase [Propionibacterium sp.]
MTYGAESPFLELKRSAWADLAAVTAPSLDEETIRRLRSKNDPTSMAAVSEVYLPLTDLINIYIDQVGHLYRNSNRFLGQPASPRTPFVIGIAGSVAVGKSTTARLLRELLRRSGRKVDLVTTDGFLYSNAQLERRGILDRKGFPESYDRRALLRFITDVKSGVPEVKAPVYSHMSYDIVEGEYVTVGCSDVVIVEGLNVLQPARRHADDAAALAVSDFFDFSVYVDADEDDIRTWFVQRFLELRRTAFTDPRSFFTRFAEMPECEARELASGFWDDINGPNLALNIRPTRDRATVILRKGPDHEIEHVRIRKI